MYSEHFPSIMLYNFMLMLIHGMQSSAVFVGLAIGSNTFHTMMVLEIITVINA